MKSIWFYIYQFRSQIEKFDRETMSYPSRAHRFYGRSGGRSQNFHPEESYIENSEDFQRILDDDSKCARLLKKIFRDERSIDIKIQRIQEFENYLEKSDSNKVGRTKEKLWFSRFRFVFQFIMKLAQPALNLLFQRFQER